MKIKILSVGKLKNKAVQTLITSYTKRLRSPYLVDFVNVKISKSSNIDKVKEEEGTLILKKIEHDFLVALDEKGDHIDSIRFSKLLRTWLDKGKNVSFVIGGAAGLSEELLLKADKTISLSEMTLPHDLALLFLVEQLYRAMTIVKGIPYHKA